MILSMESRVRGGETQLHGITEETDKEQKEKRERKGNERESV